MIRLQPFMEKTSYIIRHGKNSMMISSGIYLTLADVAWHFAIQGEAYNTTPSDKTTIILSDKVTFLSVGGAPSNNSSHEWLYVTSTKCGQTSKKEWTISDLEKFQKSLSQIWQHCQPAINHFGIIWQWSKHCLPKKFNHAW